MYSKWGTLLGVLTAPSNVDDQAAIDHSAASELLGRCHRVNGLLAFEDVADLRTGSQTWGAHQAENGAEKEKQINPVRRVPSPTVWNTACFMETQWQLL